MTDKLNLQAPTLQAREDLSALMDAELESDAVLRVCRGWSQDAETRATWHAYHLIGDVLRSEDLATPPACDEAFMQTLRARLVLEPVPLAPAPLMPSLPVPAAQIAATGRSSRWWMAPAAVAAGFVAVAGLLVVTRTFSPDASGGAVLAQRSPGAGADGVVLTAGALVRSPGLDRYLEAHRSLANGAVAAGGAEHRVQIVFESK